MVLSTKFKIQCAHALLLVIQIFRKVCQLSNVVSVKRNGLKWILDLKEGIDFSIYLMGSFEPQTVATYQKILNPGDIVVDIGANIGAHTLPLAYSVGPTGCVVAVEPTQKIFAKLMRNIHQNPELIDRVQAHQIMLMENDAAELPKTVYSSWPLGGSSKAHPLHCGVAQTTAGAKAQSLDSLLTELKISSIKLIKMDVDGYEFEVLSGASKTIRRDKPDIILEYSPYTMEERNISTDSFVNFFISHGYSFFDLDGQPINDSQRELPIIKPGSGINILARANASV